MNITSPAFGPGEPIPNIYTCDGDRFLSPPLEISDVPQGCQSLVLIMEDPDVPRELKSDGNFTHWVVFNIPPGTSSIAEGASIGVMGANERGEPQYTGPCPPPDYQPKTHRYIFQLYALDTTIDDLSEGASKDKVQKAMVGHVLEETELVGTYSRA